MPEAAPSKATRSKEECRGLETSQTKHCASCPGYHRVTHHPLSLPYAAQCLIICGLIAFSQSHLLQLGRIVIQPQDRSKQFRQIFVWQLFVSIIGDCQGRDVWIAVESHTAILSRPRAGRFPGGQRLVRRRHSQRRGAGIRAGSAAGSAGRRRRAAPVPARRLAQGCQDSRRCRGKILLIYHNSLI